MGSEAEGGVTAVLLPLLYLLCHSHLKWGIQEKQGQGQEDGMRLELNQGWNGDDSAPRPWAEEEAHKVEETRTEGISLGGLCLAL